MKKTKYKDSEIICLSKEDKTRVYKKRKHYNGYTKFEDLTAMVLLVGVVVALGAYVIAGLSKLIGFDLGEGWRIIVCASIILTLSVNIILRVKFMPAEDRVGWFSINKLRKVRGYLAGSLFLIITVTQLITNTQTEDAKFFNRQLDKMKDSNFMEYITEGNKFEEDFLINLAKVSSIGEKQALINMYYYYKDMWIPFHEVEDVVIDDLELDLYTGTNVEALQRQESMMMIVDAFSKVMGLAQYTTDLVKDYSQGELAPEAEVHLATVSKNVELQLEQLTTQIEESGKFVVPDVLRIAVSLVKDVALIYLVFLLVCKVIYKNNLKELIRIKYV